jgi:hypothetical protein
VDKNFEVVQNLITNEKLLENNVILKEQNGVLVSNAPVDLYKIINSSIEISKNNCKIPEMASYLNKMTYRVLEFF